MFNCKFCNREFSSNRGRSLHQIRCELNPNRRNIEGHPAWNKGLTAETDYRVAKRRYKIRDRLNSGDLTLGGKPHSEETKKKLSEIRKKYLQEHPENHVWKRNSKFKSEPCEHLKKELREKGVFFVEEFEPMSDRYFSIDIAFPSLLIGIEINGNQHYNRDGTLKTYYQNRHDILERLGWKIYEIPYYMCYKIDNFDDILSMDVYNIEYVKEYLSKRNKRNLRLMNEKKNREENKNKSDEIERKFIENRIKIVNESNIDFDKFGWISKISKLFCVSASQTSRWIRKYMPDFYNLHKIYKK